MTTERGGVPREAPGPSSSMVPGVVPSSSSSAIPSTLPSSSSTLPSSSNPYPPSTSPVLAAAAASPPAPPPAADRPELPWAFIDCPSDTLVVLIAHMLELLCQHNDQVVLTPDALTRFHSRAPPGISIIEYLRRIVKYTNLEKIPLVSLLAYIDLTCQNLPTFTLSSLTVHRFLIAGVAAGSKAQCDVFCTNSHYAKVGGIKVTELNSLEREFLRVTGWALCCTSDLLQRYYSSLIRSHGGYTQAAEPEVSPFLAFPSPAELAAAADSVPPTPAGTDDQDGEMESDADADGDGDADGDAGSDFSDGEGEEEGEQDPDRGRKLHREEDLPPTPVSADASSDADAMEVDTDSPRTKPTPAPPRTSSQGSASQGRGLKSLVGGIFRRQESKDRGGAEKTRGRQGQGQAQAEEREKEKAGGGGGGGGGGGAQNTNAAARSRPAPPPPSSPDVRLTPRVRTRDERSVESLRGVGGGIGVGVGVGVGVGDEGKRRARVE